MATLKLNEWVVVGSASQTKAIATTSGYVNFTLTYYLEAMLTSQSVALNQWSGKCRARVTRSGGTGYSSSMTASCTHCANYSGVATPEAVLTTGTFTLYGNDAGESSLHLVGSLSAVVGGFSISVDAWAAAPTIPRASQVSVSPSVLTVGDTLTINTNRAVNTFIHSITVKFDDYYWNTNPVSDYTTWSAPVAELMPYMNTWQKTVEVYCTTWNGTTNLGTTKTTFTLQVDTSVYKPVIAWGTASDMNATTSALETAGSFIKGYSNLQIQATATPNDSTYGDQVTKLTVALGNVSQTNSTAGSSVSVNFMANGITTATLAATATDSRGYSVTVTKALTLVNYSPISISTIEVARVNANGDETETGEYLKYTIKGKAFLGSFGQVTNALTVSTEAKQASASAYDPAVAEQTVTTTGSGYGDFTINGITVGQYSASTQFDVKFSVADALSSATYGAIRVHEGVPVAAWGEDHFDVYGQFHIHDRDDVTKYTTIYPNGYRWNLLGTATGGSPVALNLTRYSEVMLVLRYAENSTYTWFASTTIPVAEIGSSYIYCMMPARIAPTSASDFGGVVRIKLDSANAFEFVANRASQTPTLKVYAR